MTRQGTDESRRKDEVVVLHLQVREEAPDLQRCSAKRARCVAE